MYQLIHETVSQVASLSTREKRIFEEAFTFRQVPKKFRLIQEGEVAKELYFVNRGLLRLFYTKAGEEITAFIFQEGLFGSAYDSFLRQSPSIQSLETLEDCELLVISKEQMDELYKKLPIMNTITRKIAEQRFINAQKILSSFILDSPEERYRKFEEDHRDLIQRVPQHYIASFLEIIAIGIHLSSKVKDRLLLEKN